MKAITVKQPWAWAILHGKNVENRTRVGTWIPARDSRIAIHAGLQWSIRGAGDDRVREALAVDLANRLDTGLEEARDAIERNGVHPSSTLTGVLLGTALLVDVHQSQTNDCWPEVCNPWGEESYVEHGGRRRSDVVHLVLADPRPCAPIPCRGALGLWTLPADIASALPEVGAA